jgi:hypothetical protein
MLRILGAVLCGALLIAAGSASAALVCGPNGCIRTAPRIAKPRPHHSVPRVVVVPAPVVVVPRAKRGGATQTSLPRRGVVAPR